MQLPHMYKHIHTGLAIKKKPQKRALGGPCCVGPPCFNTAVPLTDVSDAATPSGGEISRQLQSS